MTSFQAVFCDVAAAVLVAVMAIVPAAAQTHDQIIDTCRNTVGRNFVQNCMPQKRDLSACRGAACA
jgi:hypothetical protein